MSDYSPGAGGDELPLNNPEWVPQRAIEALTMQRQFSIEVDENGVEHQTETPQEFSQRLIDEWLPAVTMGMIHQALYSTDEKVRLAAGKYLMDRSLGHPFTNPLPSRNNAAFADLLNGVVVDGEVLETSYATPNYADTDSDSDKE